MYGLVGIFGVAVIYDVFAISRQKETISSACRRTMTHTAIGRAGFLAGMSALTWHLIRRAV